jgi:hypothetical protein
VTERETTEKESVGQSKKESGGTAASNNLFTRNQVTLGGFCGFNVLNLVIHWQLELSPFHPIKPTIPTLPTKSTIPSQQCIPQQFTIHLSSQHTG